MLRYDSENFAWSLIDTTLLCFSSFTIAYEFILITRLPLWLWYPSAITLLGLAFFLKFRNAKPFWKNFKFDSTTITLIILGIMCSTVNIFTLRPDLDDLSFFHRAMYSLIDLSKPISMHSTDFDIKPLPALSPVFLTSSIEVVSALIAKILGINPIFFYQQIDGSISLFIFPLIYFSIFRYLKFSRFQSILGTIFVIYIYLFSGDSHVDWGNFTFLRAWQGKCILVTLLVPLSALLTFKFLQTGSTLDLIRLNLVALSGIGLSGTAYFLIPFIVGISVLGAIPFQYKQPDLVRKIILLGSIIIIFLVFVVIIKAGAIPDVINTDVWQWVPVGTKHPYWVILENTIFVRKTTLIFYLISILCILLFYRSNSEIVSFVISSICGCLAIFTPPISSFLIKITLSAAYWRLAYATQMPLLIGIFILLCIKDKDKQILGNKFNIGFGIVFIISFALLKTPAINPKLITSFPALKFNLPDLEFAKLIEHRIPFGAVADMPEELVFPLALLRPDIGFISTRYADTIHVFANVDRKQEGLERAASQRELDSCGKGEKLKNIIDLHKKLIFVVFPEKCNPRQILSNLSLKKSRWKITHSIKYQMWEKSYIFQ